MASKIATIAWVSKDRATLLERSIIGVEKALTESGRAAGLVVSGTSTLPATTTARHIDKEVLFTRLILQNPAVPPEIIRFALFGDAQVVGLGTQDTGSNRNALLLSLVDQTFLTVDDDVRAEFASMSDSSESIVFDPLLRSRVTAVFEDRAACERAVAYPERSSLTEFLTAHEHLLGGTVSEVAGGRVVVTVSGIHGDSGATSPRDLLLLNFPSESIYKKAVRNKLLLRYVTDPTVTNRPLFMTMCAGLDNRACLPPFFPQGRNQDGVFASALRAGLPSALIGYVPWVVRHDPVPAREYPPGEVRLWRFRISELLNLLLEDFTKTHPALETEDNNYERYAEVGAYLEVFAAQEPRAFVAALRALCTPNLDLYTAYLRKLASTKQEASPLQAADMISCADQIEAGKKFDTYCIPEELLALPSTDDALLCARNLVRQYGGLLRHWTTLRLSVVEDTLVE